MKSVEDLLNSSTFELIYNYSDLHTYLHYNETSTSSDLLLVTSDISEPSRRYVIEDPGSGHRQVIAEVSLGSPCKHSMSFSRVSWNFKEADWTSFSAMTEQ
ncbi:hypothetical protein TNIN_64831 [Trichonephila inaurata madagascariensis]|uniref:Uncharacterized protein n=1 Tax=Trichonephila inaurata madagascariensis TaxID=2747483 RepID=A0A8X6YAH3_9ARAC|nr:hypothetical protein TNIN_64831 [Trichonephila inaurata madagascariensis]